ncbi:NAD(P)-dependent glycerol-3-phosphate dehydrogenase [bacterium]|nr:NAD(P)-dependent glycerol-3-phosphate dehydrogenase [candidate division CSSED10-310 bacterium]
MMEREINQISVVGAGSWGTALALLLGEKGYRVRLWVYEPELVDAIRETGINRMYLPGIRIPEAVQPDHSLKKVLEGSEFVVWVTPSHTIRDVLESAKRHIEPGSIFVGASKGIENNSLMRVSEIVGDVLKADMSVRYVTLSGPTFAHEVVRRHPTTAVIAGKDPEALKAAQRVFNTRSFRIYLNDDEVGVELGGALKNVIAIAAGITAGLNLGSNSRAALITRGLWEIVRLGRAMGANPLTFLGLAGMGDLILTCDGTRSRNFLVGKRIGEGEPLRAIQESMRMVAEGVKTTLSARQLAQKYNIEMPITEKVYEVLYHEKSPHSAIEELMTRKLKFELYMDNLIRDDSGDTSPVH